MLTNRARWLILFSVAGTAVGLLRRQEVLSLVSLSVMIWLFIEWFLFRVRLEIQFRHLACERTVNESAAATGTLWAGRPVSVSVRIVARKAVRIPLVRFEDALPENIEATGDDHVLEANVSGNVPIRFAYKAQARAAGQVILPGVSARICDLHGMFFARRFLPARQAFRVLPTCVDVETGYPTVKRFNALPPPGIHRLQRAGMGSELLELREYVPGDPPKSIAWKVSAKRGCLMTRQYETDVPVRTLLFVDGSYGTRLGHFGQRPLDHLMFLAATIAKSAMSVRDPAGLELFDDAGTRSIRPGLGERQFFRILEELSDFATTGNDPFVRGVGGVNPLFNDIGHVRDLRGTRPTPPPCLLTPELMNHAWTVCNRLWPELVESRVNRLPFTWLPIRPQRRAERRRRSLLATALCELYPLPVDAAIRLVHDDNLMASCLQRLLTDAGFAWTSPLVDRRRRELHNWHAKFETLRIALTRAVSVGRDNELYVLLLDLVDFDGPLGRLANAIRIARARHHRVVVICPLPGGYELLRPGDETPALASLEDQIRYAEQLRLTAAADRLKKELRRLGAAVAFTADRESVRLVLTQAELARNGRSTAAGRRS